MDTSGETSSFESSVDDDDVILFTIEQLQKFSNGITSDYDDVISITIEQLQSFFNENGVVVCQSSPSASSAKNQESNSLDQTHMDQPPVNDASIFKCTTCAKNVKNQTMLDVHRLFHRTIDIRLVPREQQQPSYRCFECCKPFKFTSDHNIHVLFHEKKCYTCDSCQVEFWDYPGPNWFQNWTFGPGHILCRTCDNSSTGMSADNNSDLQLIQHFTNVLYCRVCEMRFKITKKFMVHIHDHERTFYNRFWNIKPDDDEPE